MLITIGCVLIAMGVLSILFGDKEVANKGGVVLRTFSAPEGQARWTKWLIGIGLIAGGLMILSRAV